MRPFWPLALSTLYLTSIALSTEHGTCQAADPQISQTDQEKINQALPKEAIVKPKQPRKLLIFGLNVGYPGHGSIRYANYAFSQMGKQTGAFESVISDDPEMFRPETLQQFDAVFFNNNVGNLFQDPELRRSLVQFIYSGGGMLGVHGTTVAFTQWPGAIEDWPEFGRMIGGRGANHKDNDEHVVIKLEDPTNPLLAPFNGASFDYRDEFFRVHEPYSRGRVRVLLSIDTEKTDMSQGGPPRGKVARADNDYALAWIRNYGRGRVFYCTIAHNPYVFWDARMLEFYLGAIQFALGDLPVPTAPSDQLTPAQRAREQLGWALELCVDEGSAATLFETIELAQQCKIVHIGALATQDVSDELARPLGGELSGEDLRKIRFRLDDAGVRLLTYSLSQLPSSDDAQRQVFETARTLGAELVRIDQLPLSLDSVKRLAGLAREFDIRIASPSTPFHHGGDAQLSDTDRLHVGHDIDLTEWIAEDLGGIVRIRRGPNRVFTCLMPTLPVATPGGTKLSSAETERRLASVMQMFARPQLRPVVIRIVPPQVTSDTPRLLAPSIEMFDKVCTQLK